MNSVPSEQLAPRELRPGRPWQRMRRSVEDQARGFIDATHLSAWTHPHLGTRVISTLEQAEAPDGDDLIPQWHLSVTQRGERPSELALADMVAAFGIDQFEIDNHHPGYAQHLWIPIDPARRVDCECKADEMIIVEPDGYVWTTPEDGPCRGCEFAHRPCPIHDTKTVAS